MGAWGSGILQDDTALDFLDELRAMRRSMDRVREALDAAAEAEYLEYDPGQAALVSAAIVDAVLRGTSLAEDDEELQTWLAALDVEDARSLQTIAAKACRRLLAPASELQELWAENQEEFPRWKEQIEGLIARLTA